MVLNDVPGIFPTSVLRIRTKSRPILLEGLPNPITPPQQMYSLNLLIESHMSCQSVLGPDTKSLSLTEISTITLAQFLFQNDYTGGLWVNQGILIMSPSLSSVVYYR